MGFDNDEPVLLPSRDADRSNTITRSKCGVLFDAYVKQALSEPFANSVDDGPASRTVTSLWAGRGLRIKVGGGYWHKAKVHEWKQWCAEPRSSCMTWLLTVSLLSSTCNSHKDESNAESIQPWNLVKLQGLQSGAVYNGKLATVLGFDESKRRFQVRFQVDVSTKVLLVKPENLELVRELTREVGRINIHGGGTLIGDGGISSVNVDRDADNILSFEWLDAAEPDISLDPLTMKEEQFQGPSDEMPPGELEAKRAVNLAAFHERTPTIAGPPDCNPDGSPCSTPRRMAYDAYANEYADTLIGESRTDLLTFRATLMEQPLVMWTSAPICDRLVGECSIDAIKVMVEVLKRRFVTGCFRKMVLWVFEHLELPPGCNTLQEAIDTTTRLHFSLEFYRLTASYSKIIGSMHEKSGQYRKAIPWFQQALDIGSRAYDEDHESVVAFRHDLALTYTEAGFLGKALETFDAALKVNSNSGDGVSHVVAARRSLLKEMQKWTGTSGYAVLEDGCKRLRGERILQTQKMVLPQTIPAYLGGSPKGNRSRNPTCERYVSLPRPLTLPPLHSSAAKFSDEEAKKAYMSMYNGDCTVEWMENISNFKFTITAECHLDGEFQGPLITLWYEEVAKEAKEKRRALGYEKDNEVHEIQFATERYNSKFRAYTSEDQKWALVLRAMHLFVRLYGVRLTSVSINKLCSMLFKEYVLRKWWAEAIDVTVIWIDLAFALGNSIHGLEAFNRLGETMEATGNFAEAGQVYQDAVEIYFPSSDKRTILHLNSGLAYKRARDYTRAEKQYVAALHLDCRQSIRQDNWDLNYGLSNALVSNVILLYNEWCRETSNDSVIIDDPSERRRILSLLGALLFATGFQASSGGAVAGILSMGPTLVDGCLKAELASENRAKQALVSIVSTPNVSDFRSKMLACERPDVYATIGVSEGSNRSQEDDKRSRKSAQKEVRNQTPIASFSQCANKRCLKVGQAFMQCACRSVTYCSKECQKLHWRAEHRSLCTTRKKETFTAS